MKSLPSLNLRKRDIAYFAVGCGAIFLLLAIPSGELTYLITLLYFVATTCITFRLIDKREQKSANVIETPVSYFERESSLNSENVVRGIVLAVSAIVFVTFNSNWRYLLILFWLINFAILLLAAAYYKSKPDMIAWIIASKFNLPIQTTHNIINKLNKKTPKEITTKDITYVEFGEKKGVLDLYLKLKREK